MSAERFIKKEDSKLPPEFIVFFAGPAFLVSLSLKQGYKGPSPPIIRLKDHPFDEKSNALLDRLSGEYQDIYNLLVRAVGKGSIAVVRNQLLLGKSSEGQLRFWREKLPESLDEYSQQIPLFDLPFGSTWLRDVYTIIGDRVFVNPVYWSSRFMHIENAQSSLLGEEGKIRKNKKVILVTPDLWLNCREEIEYLSDLQYKVSPIPFVDPKKQKYDFMEDHTDGHTALIENQDGDLVLVVCRSYFSQDKDTRSCLNQATRKTHTALEVINDNALPPLALNLIQLLDGTILCTSTKKCLLEKKLASIVGAGKVLTTRHPLNLLSQKGFGGIACLTNWGPRSFLDIQ